MSNLDNPQLELLLLRACVGMQKIMYNLRSASGGWIEGSTCFFDDVVHQSLVHIYNTRFTMEHMRLVGCLLSFVGKEFLWKARWLSQRPELPWCKQEVCESSLQRIISLSRSANSCFKSRTQGFVFLHQLD